MSVLRHQDWIDPRREFHLGYYSQYIDPTGTPHSHDFHEIFLTYGGTFFHHINGQTVPLLPGSLVWIRPRDSHTFLPGQPTEKYGFYNLAFLSDVFAELLHFLGGPESTIGKIERFEQPPMRLLGPESLSKLLQRLNRLALLDQSNISTWRAEARSLLVWMMSEHFSDSSYANTPNEWPKWLCSLCDQMLEVQHFSVGVSRMVDLSSRSHEHLSRSFQKYVKMTPTRWLHQIRIRYAAHMLACSNRDILDIMLECGYENTSYFYRLFKEQYAVSPSKYRNLQSQPLIP